MEEPGPGKAHNGYGQAGSQSLGPGEGALSHPAAGRQDVLVIGLTDELQKIEFRHRPIPSFSRAARSFFRHRCSMDAVWDWLMP